MARTAVSCHPERRRNEESRLEREAIPVARLRFFARTVAQTAWWSTVAVVLLGAAASGGRNGFRDVQTEAQGEPNGGRHRGDGEGSAVAKDAGQ